MAAGTLVSRILGFGKTWMLGAALGLGSTVNDTFINANNLPNLIFLLVAGGVFNAVQARRRTGERTTSAGSLPWPCWCCSR
jgi:peptidoglycan biosynthesis protein MviN/MurJ (putative lipid II flippase)